VTKLLYHRNIDGVGRAKEYMSGNEDNLESHLGLCKVSRSNATCIESNTKFSHGSDVRVMCGD
jgi:hypothetical protein